jgi:hypothetical protein
MLDDSEKFEIIPKPIFERVVAEGEPVGLAELMGLDYSDSFPEFGEFLRTLVYKYEIFNRSQTQNIDKNIFQVVIKNGIRTFVDIKKYDSFDFNWLVFDNLIQLDKLPEDFVAKMSGSFRTVDVVKEAIEGGFLFELGEFTTIEKKSGFFYYNFAEGGFEKKSKRHTGFYVVNEDKSVSVFHNLLTKSKKGGVRETKFKSVGLFKNYLLRNFEVYTNNATTSLAPKYGNMFFKKMRENMGHFDKRKTKPKV